LKTPRHTDEGLRPENLGLANLMIAEISAFADMTHMDGY